MKRILPSALVLLLAACVPKSQRYVSFQPKIQEPSCNDMNWRTIGPDRFETYGRETKGMCLTGYIGDFMLVQSDLRTPYAGLKIKCPCPPEEMFVSVFPTEEHAERARLEIERNLLRWERERWSRGLEISSRDNNLASGIDYIADNPYPLSSSTPLSVVQINPRTIEQFIYFE
jgi:hypothetical protein